MHLPGPDGAPWPWSPLRPVDGARNDPKIAHRAAAAVAVPLLRGGRETVLLIDDAHWIDPDSLAVLAAFTRQLAGSQVRCVCTARIPTAGGNPELPATVRELRREGLVHSVRLTPLPRREVARQVTAALQATPEPALVDRVHEVSRGVVAAIGDTIEMLRRNGSVEIVDRQAYLVQRTSPVAPPAHNQLVRMVRELGPEAWAAAKAVSVLWPLGAAVPRLVAEVLGTPEAAELLDALCRAGIIHRGRGGASWRFTVPLVASALTASLGPFERRRLAATAVTAVWSGEAACGDTDYLTDQVAGAGRLVDRQRALGELLTRSAAVQQDQAESAVRWLGAAIELAENRAQRAMVLLMHTSTCHIHGDYEESLRGAQSLLGDYADQLSPDAAQEIQLMAVQALHGVGDAEALRELAEQRRRWTGGPDRQVVTAAFACAALDRWSEAHKLLADNQAFWRAGNATSAMLGELLATMAELWSGRTARFERSLAARERWALRGSARHRLDQVSSHVSGLLVTGDLSKAEKLLIDEDLPATALPLYDQAMIAGLRGDAASAIDLTRRGVVAAGRGHEPGYTGMLQTTIGILVAQGRLTTARELLRRGRALNPVLAHLLDAAEARLDRALGENERAESRLREALDSRRAWSARGGGPVLGGAGGSGTGSGRRPRGRAVPGGAGAGRGGDADGPRDGARAAGPRDGGQGSRSGAGVPAADAGARAAAGAGGGAGAAGEIWDGGAGPAGRGVRHAGWSGRDAGAGVAAEPDARTRRGGARPQGNGSGERTPAGNARSGRPEQQATRDGAAHERQEHRRKAQPPVHAHGIPLPDRVVDGHAERGIRGLAASRQVLVRDVPPVGGGRSTSP